MLIVALPVVIGLLIARWLYVSSTNIYCNRDSALYQTIVDEKDKWIAALPDKPDSYYGFVLLDRSIVPTELSTFPIRAKYDSSFKLIALYVVVQPGFHDGVLGNRGLVYFPDEPVPEFLYEYEELSDGIYCYDDAPRPPNR